MALWPRRCGHRTAPTSHTDLEWEPVVALAIVAAPLSLVLKASDYLLTARIDDQLPSWRNALKVAVVASAANLLPLRGSLLVIVKTLALSVAGAATVALTLIPGGLGVREAFIADLAPLIGLDVEAGILLGVFDRVAWLGFLALAGFALWGQRSSVSRSDNATS